jgi:hypothetical protein
MPRARRLPSSDASRSTAKQASRSSVRNELGRVILS